MTMTLDVRPETFPLREVFTISRGSRREQGVITVSLRDGACHGWGEGAPTARYGETASSVVGQIETLRRAIEDGLTREALNETLAPGAARNALDCALWDLAAKRAGERVWALAGLAVPGPVITAYTLSLDTPLAMRDKASANSHRPVLKVKLGGGADDLARVEAVHAGAPQARIVVDANEGWDDTAYERMAPELARLGVILVEQPLPAGQDDALAELPRPIALCADESCHDRASLPELMGKYDVVNIKLDKTGGLTEALALREAARLQGFEIMVGCMTATSLAMAPATLVAQGAKVVDLDGPLLLAEDREPALRFDAAGIHPPEAALWG